MLDASIHLVVVVVLGLSELIRTSSSRSSKSASINSSSNEESKTSKFVCEGSQEDSSSKIDMPKEELTSASAVLEPSPISGEPLLGLKLGKRLYFEDLCRRGDTQNPSFFVAPIPSLSTGKKFKSSSQNPQPPRCQVQGCSLDLSSAKDYHRKQRVCESHSKSPMVVVGGLERRFCQQCSRFHSLSEFDDKKRSCRRRLSNHNARRRKPHPDTVQLNPSPLSTSPYDRRQRMSLFAYPRATTNLAWQDINSIKLPQTKDFHMKPEGTNGQVYQHFNGMSSTVTAPSDDSSSPFTSEGISVKIFNSGAEDSIGTSNEHPTKEFSRAHSLLSSNSWGSYETKSVSHTDHAGVSQPITHSMMQRSPLLSSEDWQTHRQPIDSCMCISFSDCDGSNLFHNLEQISSSHDSGFPY